MQPELLVTGEKFTGKHRAIDPVLRELIETAEREIQVAVYVFAASAIEVIRLLEAAATRGVKVTVVLNRLRDQPESIRDKLIQLENRYPHVRLEDFKTYAPGQLHAKIVVADRSKAIVGSANFSWGGLVVNHEVAILMEGDLAWQLAKLIDGLA